ncbi:ABC transporter substrate-binding protein [Pseudochelatococcus sp. B33]
MATVTGAQAKELTDVLGRTVDVPETVERIVLGEGRLSHAVALLDRENPFERVVGWQNDLRKLDPHTFEAYAQQFPQVNDIALIGEASEISVNVETILGLKPDLVLFSVAGEGPRAHSPLADTLEAAGIPVLYVDFRVAPVKNTPASIRLLGEALGRSQEAEEFASFYAEHLHRIVSRTSGLADSDRPAVFLELLAGAWPTPGHTTGKGGLGEFLDVVGGRNVAAGTVPGAIGDVSVEFILSANPDLYIATGNREPGLVLGNGVDEASAEASFRSVLSRLDFVELPAIKEGRAHGLWHDFYNSPYNIVALEALATWVQPDLFPDIDPAATDRELNERFLTIRREGTYWIEPPAAL